METRQIEKQLNRYVPDLNVPFEDLQKQLTAFIQAEREQLKTRILKGESGFATCKIHTEMWDAVIQKVYEVASVQIHDEYQKQIDVQKQLPDFDTNDLETELGEWVPDVALYGVGSYGRNELCYYSDVDVIYTSSVDLEGIYDESTLELIRWFYDFFDSLHSVIPGFEFSFIYRPLADIAQWNYQDMTALIDMRFIAGKATLTEHFRKAVSSGKSDISLVLDLLKSKADSFEASEETIYLNQPNVKTEGAGYEHFSTRSGYADSQILLQFLSSTNAMMRGNSSRPLISYSRCGIFSMFSPMHRMTISPIILKKVMYFKHRSLGYSDLQMKPVRDVISSWLSIIRW